MNLPSISLAQRLAGWLLSLAVIVTILLLSGKLHLLATDRRLAISIVIGIVLCGEILARLAERHTIARRREMLALITPFYATLRRTVKAEVPDKEDAAADEEPEAVMEYEFDAATAAVVRDEDSARQDEGGRQVYELHRYARSPEGEYFWMILEVLQGKPRLAYIKHVKHSVARYALGKSYLPPPPKML